MSMKIFLDDERKPNHIYGAGADNEWVVVKTVEALCNLISNNKDSVTHVSLDNDLGVGQEEGHIALRWMIENNIWPSEELYAHTANIYWRIRMEDDIKHYYYNEYKLLRKEDK